MAAVCIYAPTIGALKHSLKELFPAVKSSHLTEALAAAAGFRTHAALQAAFSPTVPTSVTALNEGRFIQRLVDFGYPAPEQFVFGAVDLVKDNPVADVLAELESQSLHEMGRGDTELYHLCRVLQERGSKLPTFLSHKTIVTLLQQHGFVKNGHTVTNRADLSRHMAELFASPVDENPDLRNAPPGLNIMLLDFTKPVETRKPRAEDTRSILRHSTDKIVVKGIPPKTMWKPLYDMAFAGTEVEFSEVIDLSELADRQGHEAADILDSWRKVLWEIAQIYRMSYDVMRLARFASGVTTLNSLDQQFITTIAPVRRQADDAGRKLSALVTALVNAKVTRKGINADSIAKIAGHPGSIYSANQDHGRLFRNLLNGVEHVVVAPSGRATSMLDKLTPADQLALQEWAAQQTPGANGSIDLNRWPGWADAIARGIGMKMREGEAASKP